MAECALRQVWSFLPELLGERGGKGGVDGAALATAKESAEAFTPLLMTHRHWDTWLQPSVPQQQHQVRLCHLWIAET